jgi:hypothetical protein
MSSYLTAVGLDPARSLDRVYDIIAGAGIPTRVILGPWDNEAQKRVAGYAACTHDYVLRFDADEVCFFDDTVLDKYFSSRRAIAQAGLSPYFTPDWMLGVEDDPPRVPRLGVLFDRRKVPPEEHLRHLWLVPQEAVPPVAHKKRDPSLFGDAIAFFAHLSGWRTIEGSRQRAAYYIFQYARSHGLPGWQPAVTFRAVPDSADVVDQVNAELIQELLVSSDPVSSYGNRLGGPVIASPIGDQQEQLLVPLYQRFLDSHTQLHQSLSHDALAFVGGQLMLFEITAPESLAALGHDRAVMFQVENANLRGAWSTVTYLLTEEPWESEVSATVEIDGNRLRLALPSGGDVPANYVRRVLRVVLSSDADNGIGYLRCIPC